MTRRAGGKDFAPLVRSALYRAIEDPKVDLQALITKHLLEDPIGTLRQLSAYTSHKIDITMERTLTTRFEDIPPEDLALLREMRKAKPLVLVHDAETV